MTDPGVAAVVTALEFQRAGLIPLVGRLRVAARQLPPEAGEKWMGVASAFFEFRRQELESSLDEAVRQLDAARSATDQAIATLGSRVG